MRDGFGVFCEQKRVHQLPPTAFVAEPDLQLSPGAKMCREENTFSVPRLPNKLSFGQLQSNLLSTLAQNAGRCRFKAIAAATGQIKTARPRDARRLVPFKHHNARAYEKDEFRATELYAAVCHHCPFSLWVMGVVYHL